MKPIVAQKSTGERVIFHFYETGKEYDNDYNGYEKGGLHVTINGSYLSNFRDREHFDSYFKLMRYTFISELES